ncbi:hypothetical protein KXV44_006655, partial [Aspergillus fumigatus]
MQLSRFAAFANRSVSDVRFFAEPCLTTQDMENGTEASSVLSRDSPLNTQYDTVGDHLTPGPTCRPKSPP